MKSDYIYIITHVSAYIINNEHTQKIGSTRNPLCRFASYKTYYPRNIIVTKLYKINQNCYMVDNLIKIKFNKYNIIDNGGIEFYSLKLTSKMLEDFFKELNIEFEEVDPTTVKFEYYKYTKLDKYFIADEDDEIEYCKNVVDKIEIPKPREYQIKILDSMYNHFIVRGNKYGKLIMACGTGKSLVAYWGIQRLNCKKVLILVPSLYLLDQLGKNFVEQAKLENKNYNFLFLGSDLNISGYDCVSKTEVNTIKNFINKNNNYIIFSTYQSCEVLLDYYFDIITFDEAHKTATIPKISDKDNTDSDNENNKLIYSGFNMFVSLYITNPNALKLFMTATEKICNDKQKEDEIEIISMDNKDLYGDTIYHLPIREAIKLKALCDYKIIVHQQDVEKLITPEIAKDILKNIAPNNEYFIKKYHAKALICKRFFEEYAITHVITKHSICKNARFYSEILTKLLGNRYKIFYMDGNDSIKKRNEIVNQFISCERAIICQAKVLNEGVSINECDCVAPIDDIESSIDIIQFLGRMLRLSKSKKMSYLLIPMLTSEKEDIINSKREYNNIRLLLRAISYEDNELLNYFQNFNTQKYEKDLAEKKNDDNLIVINGTSNIVNSNIALRVVKDFNKIAPETFEKAREFVRNMNFDSIKKYRDWCDNRAELFNIPKNPDSVYKSLGWLNWADWLNKKIMDKNEIKKLLSKENLQRRIKLDNMSDEDKILKYLKDGKNKTIKDICEVLGLNRQKFESTLNKIKKNYRIKYNTTHIKLDQYILDFDIIDTTEKFDEWAKQNNIPVYDELKDFYDFKDPKWLLDIEDKKYPAWDQCQRICRDYYNNNKDKYENIVDYYNDLVLTHNLPNDPSIIYKKFEDYCSLFGI